MNDTRPLWKSDIVTETEFRAILKFGRIVTVSSHWRFISDDRTEEWLVIKNDNGDELRLPHVWQRILKFDGSSSGMGLFRLTHVAEEMAKVIRDQDKFCNENESELAEYRRLRDKFEAPT